MYDYRRSVSTLGKSSFFWIAGYITQFPATAGVARSQSLQDGNFIFLHKLLVTFWDKTAMRYATTHLPAETGAIPD